MKIKIFLLKAYTHLSLDWKKKQDAKLPQLKITQGTSNTTTIKRPTFSSVISFAQIFTQRSCPGNLSHPGSSLSEECASNILVLPKSLKVCSQNPWNITLLLIPFQQRLGFLVFKLTKKEEKKISSKTTLRTPLKLWVFSLCI